MEKLLFSEILDLRWKSQHKSHEDYSLEKDKFEYERMVSYFERDRDDYTRADDRAYSNPISL